MRYTFPKKARIRLRREFRFMARHAKSQAGVYIVLFSYKTRLSYCRLGITVSKKYGRAHERNRFKRIVREAFREVSSLLPKGFDLNIKPRKLAKAAKKKDILAELLALTSKVSNDAK